MTSDLLSPAAALDHLLGAHASAGEAEAAARRSLAIGWESPAADQFRGGVSALLTALDGDRQVVGEAVAVAAS